MPTRRWNAVPLLIVTCAALLVLAPTATGVPGPELESVWEQGTVLAVPDGDTLDANMTTASLPGNLGAQRVRTIGVQAPEVGSPPQCGAIESRDILRQQLPVGATVQTRSLADTSYDNYSDGRIVRSLYLQDSEENWFDISRWTVSNGWLLWFPLPPDSPTKPEWAHNLEYRVLADDAAAAHRGIWTPGLCGPEQAPWADLRVWVAYTQSSTLDAIERVFVANQGTSDVALGGWTIRDAALNMGTFPAEALAPAGRVIELQLSATLASAYPGVAASYLAGGGPWFDNLPADNIYFHGDAAYLMDAGAAFATGNLRGWFPYPCNPDLCTDPLSGQAVLTKAQTGTPALTAPAAPGSVSATASTDGTGGAHVTWAAPNDFGGPAVTYTVSAYEQFDATHQAATPTQTLPGLAGTTADFVGLPLGRAFRFTVVASNGAADSPPAQSVEAITPVGPPAAPTIQSQASVALSATTAVLSWARPANGLLIAKYTITGDNGFAPLEVAAPGPNGPSAPTSVVLTGLNAGATYNFRVTGTDITGTPMMSSTAATIDLGAPVTSVGPPNPPTTVSVEPGPDSLAASWDQDPAGTRQPTSYTVTATPTAPAGPPIIQACTQATSCLLDQAAGITTATSYEVKVTANGSTSADSLPVAATSGEYANRQATTTPSVPPVPVADPWASGQFIDVSNVSPGVLDLGGYGLWTQFSSSGRTDQPAYLFPAGLTVAPGQTLRVRVGNPGDGPPAQPGLLAYLRTGEPGVGLTGDGATDFLTSGQYVELANLNRAQVSCLPNGGVCRAGQNTQTIASPPVGITAATTTGSATVSWGGPISTGGSPITGYIAMAYDAPVGGAQTGTCQTGGGTYSCAFPAAVGQRHYVEVAALNAQGTSAPSQRVLAAPRTIPASPSGVTAAGGPGSASVRWTPGAPNGARITHFTARAYDFSTGGAPQASCSSSGDACNITGLVRDRTYFIDVSATNKVGEGPASSPRVEVRTTGLASGVTTYSSKKVTVRWAKQPGVTRYEAAVYDAPAGGKLLGTCSGKSKDSKCTTKKVKSKKLYYIDLTFISPAGNHLQFPRIVTGPAKKASAPTSVVARAAATKVTINWAEPYFNGYSLLKSYTARVYSKAKKGSILASCSSSAKYDGCTTKATKKLKRNKVYWVAVKVKNSKGWSSYSSPRVPVQIP